PDPKQQAQQPAQAQQAQGAPPELFKDPNNPHRELARCPDGSIRLVTPFNRQNPCSQKVKIEPEVLPDDFLLVHGPPPAPTGSSLADRRARQQYRRDLEIFEGLVDEPEGF